MTGFEYLTGLMRRDQNLWGPTPQMFERSVTVTRQVRDVTLPGSRAGGSDLTLSVVVCFVVVLRTFVTVAGDVGCRCVVSLSLM